MNSTVRTLAFLLLAASSGRSSLAAPVDLRQRTEELKSLRWGMFICWSLSTFSGKEWTPGVADASHFRATGCDTDQWARTARESGMGYILFLATHHDGLCLPAEKLLRDYLGAVQYGNLFSIDVGPDYAGRLRDIDVKTLRQVGERIRAARAAPDLDARFTSAKGWLGADGIYSVALPDNRTAWLFSDTWTGVLQDGKRTQTRMINNSVGVTEGTGPAHFYYPTDQAGQAASLFLPPDGRGWYWLWAGVPDGERLGLFAARVKKTDGGGAFGFALFGTALAEVANPQDAPTAWRVRWQDMPESWKPRVFWGSSALVRDGFTYVYGYAENGGKGFDFQRHMLLARVPSGKLADFTAWRFYGKGAWHAEPEQAEPLCPGVATEYSVTYLSARKRFLLVTHDLFLSPNIVARTAEQPWGPWSDKTLVYTCPEASAQRGVFCYAAKHQPVFSDDQTLAISYAANANDRSTVLNDPSLYVPRFIRVPIAGLFK